MNGPQKRNSVGTRSSCLPLTSKLCFLLPPAPLQAVSISFHIPTLHTSSPSLPCELLGGSFPAGLAHPYTQHQPLGAVHPLGQGVVHGGLGIILMLTVFNPFRSPIPSQTQEGAHRMWSLMLHTSVSVLGNRWSLLAPFI